MSFIIDSMTLSHTINKSKGRSSFERVSHFKYNSSLYNYMQRIGQNRTFASQK